MSLRYMVRWTMTLLLLVGPVFADGQKFSFQSQAQIVSQSGDTMVLKGVRWGFRNNEFGNAIFRDTTVRLDQVREVYYYSEPFNVTGVSTALNRFQAHGLLFFEMKDPSAIRSVDGHSDIGIGVSAEARRETPAYSALKGLQKFYKLHYQVLTEKDRLQWGLTIWKERIQRFRLVLDDSQKKRLFREALEEAARDHSQEWYHAITNSCIAAACRLINTVLPDARKLKIWTIPHVWYNMKLGIPSRTPAYLIRKGVAEPEGEWEANLASVDFPTSSGSYRITLKDLPELDGGAAGAGSKTPVSPPSTVALDPAGGAGAELPVVTDATLKTAADLGVLDEVQQDATLVKQIQSSLQEDLIIH